MAVTNDQTGTQTGTGSLIQSGLGTVLSIASNAISITDSVHTVSGSGTLNTIAWRAANSPTNPAIVYLIRPASATWTFGAGGNITLPNSGVPSAETEVAIPMVWDGITWRMDKEVPRPGTVNVLSFGAKGDGVTDDYAAIQAAVNFAAQNGVVVFPPTTNGYLCKSPVIVNRNFTTLTGTGYMSSGINWDLTAYSGPYPKYFIILGDALTIPSAGSTVQGNAITNLRLFGTGATGGVLAWRSTVSKIENVTIAGSGMSYGARIVASDSQFSVTGCIIGNAGATYAPAIGVSVENGSNQTIIEKSIILGGATAIQIFNSLGTRVVGNSAIGVYAAAASSYYGIRIRNDQTVPPWLTWIVAGVGANIHILDNWFEPSDFTGATIYDIYVGDGVPTSNSIPGTVVSDCFFFGTTNATRYCVTVDYAEAAVIRSLTAFGTLTKLLNVTTHALLTKYDLQVLGPFNVSSTADAAMISDNGSKSCTMGHLKTPAFNAGNFTSNSGSWTVQSGDVTAFKYSTFHRQLSLTVYLVGTDITGTPTQLLIAIPDGYSAASDALVMARIVNAGSLPAGIAYVAANGTHIIIQKSDQTAFAADAGGCVVQFQIQLEVV